MLRREQLMGLAFLAITVAWSFAWGLSGSHEAVLFMAPALLLAIPLAFGRYVGEEQIARIRSRRHGADTRRHAAFAPPVAQRLFRALVPRGGDLIAADLAKRPPPLLLHQP